MKNVSGLRLYLNETFQEAYAHFDFNQDKFEAKLNLHDEVVSSVIPFNAVCTATQ